MGNRRLHPAMKNPFAIRENAARPLPREVYGWRIYALAFSASWASAMFGYDQSFIGGTMSLKSFQTSFGLDKQHTTSLSSHITSTFQGGAFFGAMFGFAISEWLGRRWNLMSSGVIFLLGALLQTLSHGNLGMMYAGRALTGAGVGASSLIVPIYIAESSPHTVRGRLIGMFEVVLQTASVIGFWINYGVNRHLPSTEKQWQIPFAVQTIPAGLLIICMSFMIESPRWLIKQGKISKARKDLAWVRHLPEDHPYVVAELAEISAQIDREAQLREGKRAIVAAWTEISSKKMRFRVIFAMAMKWMSNLTGTNSLNYYSPKIFNSIGFTGTSTGLFATGVYGIIKATVTLGFVFYFIDTWGRRPSLITGSMIIFCCMFYLGAYSQLSESFDGKAPRDAGAYVAIIMVYLYAGAFSISWNAMPWVFASEVFPTKIRTLGMLLAVLNQWLGQFIIVYVTPYMISGITYGTFFFFGSATFVAGIVVYCLMPETKGFTLEDMPLIFENGYTWAPKARAEAERLRAEKDVIDVLESGERPSVQKGAQVTERRDMSE